MINVGEMQYGMQICSLKYSVICDICVGVSEGQCRSVWVSEGQCRLELSYLTSRYVCTSGPQSRVLVLLCEILHYSIMWLCFHATCFFLVYSVAMQHPFSQCGSGIG